MEYQDEPGAWESVLDVLKEDAYKLGGQQLLDALDLKHTTILSDPKFNPKHETLKKYMGTELDHYTAVVEFALWDNIFCASETEHLRHAITYNEGRNLSYFTCNWESRGLAEQISSWSEYLNTPVVFQMPGGRTAPKPDTRITLFGQQILVHSLVLRLHSEYFRTFLDSKDKEDMCQTPSKFRYEYISVVDSDGEWGLEARGKAVDTSDLGELKYTDQKSSERTAFQNLLRAMYSAKCIFYPWTEIERSTDTGYRRMHSVVKLADFYLALPILNQAFYRTMLEHPNEISANIACWPFEFMELAKKLKHKLLFQEALIHAVNENKCSVEEALGQFRTTGHLDLEGVYWRAINQLEGRMRIIGNLKTKIASSANIQGGAAELVTLLLADSPDGKTGLPSCAGYYDLASGLRSWRSCHTKNPWDPDILLLLENLNHLLRNKTVLLKEHIPGCQQEANHDGYVFSRHIYLCAEISDELLPWKQTEVVHPMV